MDLVSEHRPFLLSLAYRMLGDRTEAEDIVQDAFVRAHATDPDTIRNPRAWLGTLVTRLCLDHLKSARVNRERYVGPWLPEPIDTNQDRELRDSAELSAMAESLSFAFLIVLERLSPLERAVFLLHEAFDYDHAEIGAILEREPTATRQLLSRAKQHIRDARPRFAPDRDSHRALLERFMASVGTGRPEILQALLAEQAVLITDAGGKAKAALKPILGADRIARFLFGLAPRMPNDLQLEAVEINGWPALQLRSAGRTIAIVTVETDGQQIWSIAMQMNPDKLSRFA